MSDYIPPELILNILTRLPVDDVVRCTIVCKSWYSLIISPSFASSHLNLSSPNQEPRLLVKYCKNDSSRSNFCLHRDSGTFDEISDICHPCYGDEIMEMGPPELGMWKLVDCINGLVCFWHALDGTLLLWNPSLRKSVVLPKPSGFLRACLYNMEDPRALLDTYEHSVGFGFVASSNEYKLVSFSYFNDPEECVAEIYELNTGSWRDLKGDDHLWFDDWEQAHLNGILHWSYSSCIRSFDLKKEKFRDLVIPSCASKWQPSYGSYKPCTFRDSLCLIHSSDERRSKIFNIWIMKEYGKPDSWEKLYTINIEQHSLTYCPALYRYPTVRHNGELLFEIFDDKIRPDKIELVSYDYNNDVVKNLGVFPRAPLHDDVFFAYPYVESLVLLKSPKIDEGSTEISKNI